MISAIGVFAVISMCGAQATAAEFDPTYRMWLGDEKPELSRAVEEFSGMCNKRWRSASCECLARFFKEIGNLRYVQTTNLLMSGRLKGRPDLPSALNHYVNDFSKVYRKCGKDSRWRWVDDYVE